MLRHTRRLFVCICFLAPATAWGHNVGVECKVHAERVDVEVFFDDNTPGGQASVQVVNERGEVVASGATDALGKWSFPRPGPGKHHVRVDAGAGHHAECTLPDQSSESE